MWHSREVVRVPFIAFRVRAQVRPLMEEIEEGFGELLDDSHECIIRHGCSERLVGHGCPHMMGGVVEAGGGGG